VGVDMTALIKKLKWFREQLWLLSLVRQKSGGEEMDVLARDGKIERRSERERRKRSRRCAGKMSLDVRGCRETHTISSLEATYLTGTTPSGTSCVMSDRKNVCKCGTTNTKVNVTGSSQVSVMIMLAIGLIVLAWCTVGSQPDPRMWKGLTEISSRLNDCEEMRRDACEGLSDKMTRIKVWETLKCGDLE
jgi:hypothetical protein